MLLLPGTLLLPGYVAGPVPAWEKLLNVPGSAERQTRSGCGLAHPIGSRQSAAAFEEGGAVLGQADAPRSARQKPDPELFLEPADRAAPGIEVSRWLSPDVYSERDGLVPEVPVYGRMAEDEKRLKLRGYPRFISARQRTHRVALIFPVPQCRD
jgi:hypothetical protein